MFSEAWWIGTKEENPDESRFDFPKEVIQVGLLSRVLVIMVCNKRIIMEVYLTRSRRLIMTFKVEQVLNQ